MKQRLEYVSQGRGGSLIYKDNDGQIRFYYEFGGGNCVAIIFIPSEAEWADQTGRPIAERNAILDFIAAQAITDQAPGCYYKISDNSIELFRKGG